ncbi:MAG: hypothetical protein GVY06_02770 [Alphaproteobacteria bacterium]|nr:hypothetical protein [Alphaproteobacteria bacterium]
MRALFSIFPLLVIPVAIYNIMAFAGGGDPVAIEGSERVLAGLTDELNASIMSVPMISGVTWTLTNGAVLLMLGLLFLFLEILKSTSTGTATIMNHAVSMILFIVCLIEFLLIADFATSIFFILTIMTLLDVLAGVVVTIVSARRDFAVGEGFGG